jgi:PAS domain S-box-containing protein
VASVTTILKNLSALGTDIQYSTLTNKRIELSNRISLFAVTITFFFIYYYHSIGIPEMVYIEIGFAFFYLLPIPLNYLKFTLFSRIFLNTIVFVHIFVLSLLIGHESNMYIFFIPTIMAPFALFEFSQKKIIAGLCLFNALLVSFLYAYSFKYDFSLIKLTDDQASALSKIAFYTAIVCCMIIIYSILYVNEKTTRQLDKDKETLNAQVEGIFNNSEDALFLVDRIEKKIVKANRRAIELFEVEKEENFFNFFGLDLHKNYPTEEEITKTSVQIEKNGVYEDEILYKTFKGNEFWGAITVKMIEVNDEKYQSVRITDISEKRKSAQNIQSSLKEKELLLAEVHHRVKNNLAIISALINLQVENLKDEDSKKIFEETKDRIYSMALIHNQLYQNNSFARIEFAQYINNFCSYLTKSYQTNPNIEIFESTEKIQLDIKTAIPCALILNELITNSFKHAFKNQSTGKIDVGFKKENNTVSFWVADTGSGMDSSLLQSTTMGMNLITSLVDQIDGKLNYENKNGSRFLITFNN